MYGTLIDTLCVTIVGLLIILIILYKIINIEKFNVDRKGLIWIRKSPNHVLRPIRQSNFKIIEPLPNVLERSIEHRIKY